MPQQATVLIADDDTDVRRSIRTRLTARGYRVVEADSGIATVSQCLAERVDACILDHCMPCGTGRAVARMLRQESDTPVIFISGRSRDEFRDFVMELPDMYFLGKPLDMDRLLQLLGALVPPPGSCDSARNPRQSYADA
ncbi:Response regulator MprA [Phycisphaerae bacterium RAS1]|nr:Response regulator MprA [Phycisphaerae bacterium RAS1]